MARLAVLDLDGTLVDSLDDLHASVNHALAAVGLPPRSREEVHGYVGEGARVLLSRAVAPHEHLVERALAAWRPHYEAHCLDRTRAYEGIPRERLTPAGDGFERPVASNATALGRAKNRRVEFRILTE